MTSHTITVCTFTTPRASAKNSIVHLREREREREYTGDFRRECLEKQILFYLMEMDTYWQFFSNPISTLLCDTIELPQSWCRNPRRDAATETYLKWINDFYSENTLHIDIIDALLTGSLENGLQFDAISCRMRADLWCRSVLSRETRRYAIRRWCLLHQPWIWACASAASSNFPHGWCSSLIQNLKFWISIANDLF